jgi:hypothetical protein
MQVHSFVKLVELPGFSSRGIDATGDVAWKIVIVDGNFGTVAELPVAVEPMAYGR